MEMEVSRLEADLHNYAKSDRVLSDPDEKPQPAESTPDVDTLG